MKIAYTRPDMGVPANDPSLIREVNRTGAVRYHNSDGQPNREDGPAIEWADGDRFWCRHGKLHREDGPAVERANGTRFWYCHDKLHREDGPAAEWADGSLQWFLEGKRLSKDEFEARKPATR